MSVDRLKINLMNQNQSPKPKTTEFTPLTLAQAITRVKSLNLEKSIEDAVIQRISRYPSNSFNAALRNMDRIVQDIVKGQSL